jgi:transposase
VLAECAEPGASVASVALKHGLNANLVHKWRRLALAAEPATTAVMASAQFVRIPLPQPLPSPAREDIRVELRLGPSMVAVTWPVAVLRRLKYAATSEKFRAGISPEQKGLLLETLHADLAELGREIERLDPGKQARKEEHKQQPRRERLPPVRSLPTARWASSFRRPSCWSSARSWPSRTSRRCSPRPSCPASWWRWAACS